MIPLHAITRPVNVKIDCKQSAREVLHKLEQENISGAPVVGRQGAMLGYISQVRINTALLKDSRKEVSAEEIMTPFLFSLSPHDSLEKALHMLLTARIRRVLTVDAQGAPLGVLTTLDIVKVLLRVSQQGSREETFASRQFSGLQALLRTPVQDVMTSPVVCVNPNDSLASFLQLCDDKIITGAPVVLPESNYLVGTISQSDVSRHLWSTDRTLQESQVLDVMTPFTYRVNPEDSLLSALESFVEHEIHRLIVVRASKPIGIVTTVDILDALYSSFLFRVPDRTIGPITKNESWHQHLKVAV